MKTMLTTSLILSLFASALAGQEPVSLADRLDPDSTLLSSLKVVNPEAFREAIEPDGERVGVLVTLLSTEADEFRSFDKPALVAGFRERIARRQEEVFQRLAGGNHEVTRVYRNFPGFACRVDAAALEQLLADPLVATVGPNTQVRPAKAATAAAGVPAELLTMGHDLIDTWGISTAWTGKGTAVAIVDGGVDPSIPIFGGYGSIPNEKIIGGWDSWGNDDQPWTSSHNHGETVAAIAAGYSWVLSGGTTVFYGGVAPDAKIYAFKVFPDSGGTTTTELVVDGIDRAVSAQFDDPDHPIRVINLSIGGTVWGGNCSPYETLYFAAINAARNAGISVVAASSNDGECSALSAPACIPLTISVGSVYPASVGSKEFCVYDTSCVANGESCGTALEKCVDSTTGPDIVSCYSNSDPALDLLAPGSALMPWDSGLSHGTSLAAPYVSGLIACMHELADERGITLSPSDVDQWLKGNGVPVHDPRNDLTKPRILAPATLREVFWHGDEVWQDSETDLPTALQWGTADWPRRTWGSVKNDVAAMHARGATHPVVHAAPGSTGPGAITFDQAMTIQSTGGPVTIGGS